jgi:hypothetical protein
MGTTAEPRESERPEVAVELHDREPAAQELVMHLERDQFVAATSQPVPPAPLGLRATLALWALRVFVVLVSLMVVYAFVDRLH